MSCDEAPLKPDLELKLSPMEEIAGFEKEYKQLQDMCRDHPLHGSLDHFKKLAWNAYICGVIGDADLIAYIARADRLAVHHRAAVALEN